MTSFSTDRLGLGIDAGGTQTRWALASVDGSIVAEGAVEGLSALQMSSAAGRTALQTTFTKLCQEVSDIGQPTQVLAGLTGFGGDGAMLTGLLAELLALDVANVSLGNDIEIAYRDSFELGEGYLVYAGTGSIAAWIDQDGGFHRAGGRGVLLDDGGGGYWIAREALRQIWRREDECPGSWQSSPMAEAVFAHLGGSDWSVSRDFMYGQDRGTIGRLALAVAAAADTDPLALDIVQRAGQELARLALALIDRYGPRPVVLAGRAAQLHPAIFAAMQAALPASLALQQKVARAHVAAARLAARSQPIT
ncbi:MULTISPECIES: N-acetylglucosamine kinase [unclassified Janthinobacterium]|uniref:N-acetylglucosamine kinase n=1 Tax=unclassified Janthinobacterium TaxID=2610881 RepID=UPI00181F6467|nr:MULTISPECIES: BadF/BadG/BcrA/BcrD ATPase family protein [unclassified Janthinobacterium]MBB5371511.1 N-acetylglucosamine kinase-like BadF-type ATPase [Janthinobacterium sp. K2C7]MBB5384317.1 N-acetylglucosamine kinase-like BadF-type ATPase [Janthinobacterium sp. K2Li3]MBB5389592.1 N-acetylglucosamine kinase-like BadF-type ATPase [Janthinobacterium sp. K2E3]